MSTVRFRLNGAPIELDLEERALLVDVLRGQLGLTGTHIGCDTSQCGACTVLVNGQSVKSCSVLAVQLAGAEIVTIEGLSPPGTLHPIQRAFIDCHGLQCGFCTPGMILTSWCLLNSTPEPTEADVVHAIEGNLCRCTGYVNIIKAIRQAATEMAEEHGKAA